MRELTVYEIDRRKEISLEGIQQFTYRAESKIRKTTFQQIGDLASQLVGFEFENELLPSFKPKKVETQSQPAGGIYYLFSEVTEGELTKLTLIFLQKKQQYENKQTLEARA